MLNILTLQFQWSVNLNLRSLILLEDMISHSMLSSDRIVNKLTYLMKLVLLWYKVSWMGSMEQYLLMDRLGPVSHGLWKGNEGMNTYLDWFPELLNTFFSKFSNLMEILNSQLSAVILKFIWKK